MSLDGQTVVYTFEHSVFGKIALFVDKERLGSDPELKIKELLGIPRRYGKSRSYSVSSVAPSNKTLRLC